MADDARELVAQAEHDAARGDYRSAVRALEQAYVPVQRPRDIETIERALAPAVRQVPAGPPSLDWIDGLVVVLSLFVVLELIGGAAVASAASTANERIAAIAGAVFGATMLLALIAVIRLLQAVERNTHAPPEAPPA